MQKLWENAYTGKSRQIKSNLTIYAGLGLKILVDYHVGLSIPEPNGVKFGCQYGFKCVKGLTFSTVRKNLH